ncbi:hypothetical protein GGH91_006129, partial [Coemansia sp. RSA 2671]
KEPVKAPARFGVIPSQALQREIFPWIMPMLGAVYKQKGNSSQVLVATRFLSMLKKLRMVLLQDIAFLMEVPLLNSTFAVHRPFEARLFNSPAFVAYRKEMRQALGDTEIREMENYCISTQRWIKGRKQALPRGDPQRFKPTTARILMPDYCPPSGSSHVVAANISLPPPVSDSRTPESASATPSLSQMESGLGSKRPYGELPIHLGNGSGHLSEVGASADAAELLSKRARHGYEATKVMQPTQRDDNSALAEPELERIADVGFAEQPPAHVVAAIDELRMENEDLRFQMQRIENTLAQQQTEFRGWMGRIEKVIRGNAQASVQPRSVSPDLEPAAQYYGGAMPVPAQPSSAHLHHRHPAYSSQAT